MSEFMKAKRRAHRGPAYRRAAFWTVTVILEAIFFLPKVIGIAVEWLADNARMWLLAMEMWAYPGLYAGPPKPPPPSDGEVNLDEWV